MRLDVQFFTAARVIPRGGSISVYLGFHRLSRPLLDSAIKEGSEEAEGKVYGRRSKMQIIFFKSRSRSEGNCEFIHRCRFTYCSRGGGWFLSIFHNQRVYDSIS
jgi:hypothetical protein